jgi:hypothetical protein
MVDHVTEWLGAYHDGELSRARLRQVEHHLAGCAVCQAELEEIKDLSFLLQAAAPEGGLFPAERFVANLTLRLPRQPAGPQPRRALNTAWWLMPVSLLGIWLFIEITLTLSTVVTFTTDAGLLSGYLTRFQGNPLQMSWFSMAMNLFGDQLGAPGQVVLSALNDANVFLAQLAGRLLPQAVLAFAYLGWLFSWWLRRQPSPGAASFPNHDATTGSSTP